jgi:hypothetical protein
MTLILSCLTPEHVIQVADRRLTAPDRGGELVDDDTNKVVQYESHLCFAYTGLAEIRYRATDKWLMETLSGHGNPNKAVEALKQAATDDFRKIALPAARKRHAFVGCGWTRVGGRDPRALEPTIMLVSNALEDGRWRVEAHDEFTFGRARLRPGVPFTFYATGQRLPAGIARGLIRQIEAAQGHGSGPGVIARLLGRAVRDVAASNSAVGRGLLVSILPKKVAVDAKGLGVGFAIPLAPTGERDYFTAPLDDAYPTNFYVPPEKTNGVAYGPLFASSEGTMIAWPTLRKS